MNENGFVLLDSEDPRNLAAFVCPITYELMTNPVAASDGFTYQREAIQEWMDKGGRSPLTRAELNPDLYPNQTLLNAINEYRRRHPTQPPPPATAEASTSTEPDSDPERETRTQPPPATPIHTSKKLGRIFATLDPLRNVLSSMLDGWSPPQIIVLGNENSGKSTLMERLAMIPLFPRDRRLCTRLPIEVKLRRGEATCVKMHIVDVDTGSIIEGSEKDIPAAVADSCVKEQMDAELSRVNGEVRGVCNDRRIVLQITRPDLPNLDFLDLPGLVAGALRNEPTDMMDQTKTLVENNVDRVGAAGVYLWTVKSTTPANQSLAYGILNSGDNLARSQRTIGVLTMTDKVDENDPDATEMFCEQVLQRGDGIVQLEPNGFVATSLKNPRTGGEAEQGSENYYRLLLQAREEERFFHSRDDLSQIREVNRAGSNDLLDRLSGLVEQYVGDTWVPETIRRIRRHEKEIKAKESALGIPRAHTENLLTEELRSNVIEGAIKKVISALPGISEALADSKFAEIRTMLETHLDRDVTVTPMVNVVGCINDLKDTVMRECEDIIQNIGMVFLFSRILEPLSKDNTDSKLGRFENLINAISERVRAKLSVGVKEACDTVKNNITDFFHQKPSNPCCKIRFTIPQNKASITFDWKRLLDSIIFVLFDLMFSLRTVTESWKQDLRCHVCIENCAEQRKNYLANCERLEHAKKGILDLAGKSENEIMISNSFNDGLSEEDICFIMEKDPENQAIQKRGADALLNILETKPISKNGFLKLMQTLQQKHFRPHFPITILNLKDIKFKDYGASALVKALQHIPNLKTLNLQSCHLGDNAIGEIAGTLEQVPSLSTLRIDFNDITFNGARAIANALEHIPSLKILDFEGNKIKDDGVKLLADGLQHVKLLTHLNLAHCGFTKHGANKLAESLRLCYIPQLIELRIEGNKINSKGAVTIFQKFKHIPSLTHLYLDDCGNFNVNTIESLSKRIKKLPSLTLLSLKGNGLGSDLFRTLQNAKQGHPNEANLEIQTEFMEFIS